MSEYETYATKFNATVAQMKLEILDDVRKGLVPSQISSFGDLDDYVDASCYPKAP